MTRAGEQIYTKEYICVREMYAGKVFVLHVLVLILYFKVNKLKSLMLAEMIKK